MGITNTTAFITHMVFVQRCIMADVDKGGSPCDPKCNCFSRCGIFDDMHLICFMNMDTAFSIPRRFKTVCTWTVDCSTQLQSLRSLLTLLLFGYIDHRIMITQTIPQNTLSVLHVEAMLIRHGDRVTSSLAALERHAMYLEKPYRVSIPLEDFRILVT